MTNASQAPALPGGPGVVGQRAARALRPGLPIAVLAQDTGVRSPRTSDRSPGPGRAAERRASRHP